MLKNIKKNYLILIFTILFLYFFFNLLDGQRGLISYFEKKTILEELNDEKIIITNKIDELEIKNSLLTDNLDLDYIEILIRQKFLFGKDSEKIYLIKNNEN
jgi:cell division protein FtsB